MEINLQPMLVLGHFTIIEVPLFPTLVANGSPCIHPIPSEDIEDSMISQ